MGNFNLLCNCLKLHIKIVCFRNYEFWMDNNSNDITNWSIGKLPFEIALIKYTMYWVDMCKLMKRRLLCVVEHLFILLVPEQSGLKHTLTDQAASHHIDVKQTPFKAWSFCENFVRLLVKGWWVSPDTLVSSTSQNWLPCISEKIFNWA